jgi:hypothetical protein
LAHFGLLAQRAERSFLRANARRQEQCADRNR